MSRLEFQPDPEQEQAPDEASSTQHQAASQRLAMPENAEESTADLSARFQQVEDMLRHAPLLSMPIGFADRVLAAIKGQRPSDPDYQDALGIILGLFLAVLVALPLLGIPAYLIARSIISADYRDTLVSDLGSVLGTIFVGLQSSSLGVLVLIPVLIAMLVGFGLLSGYLVRFLKELVEAGSVENK